MEKDYKFECEDCKHVWLSSKYNEDGEGKEGYYAQGLNCPSCDSKNISGNEVK